MLDLHREKGREYILTQLGAKETKSVLVSLFRGKPDIKVCCYN